MNYDAVIFDLDGTLLNTLEDLAASVNFALSDAGLPGRTVEEVRKFIGNGVLKLITRSVAPITDEETIRSVHQCFIRHYKENCENRTKPYDGIPALLTTLQAHRIPAAIVSNKADFAVKKLAQQYFPGKITLALGDREGIPRKPNPSSLLEAVHLLNCQRPLYVGDSDVDVMTAQNAKVDGIFITWGFRSREELAAAGAVHFANSAQELADMILQSK